jgi:hypothetical protein
MSGEASATGSPDSIAVTTEATGSTSTYATSFGVFGPKLATPCNGANRRWWHDRRSYRHATAQRGRHARPPRPPIRGFLHGYQDGLIELAWTDAVADSSGRYKLRHAKLFGTEQFEELVEEAVRVNSQPMVNVYIGAALRHPNTAPFARSSDSDFYALTANYCDLDEEGANDSAKHKFAPAPPSFVVCTGSNPHKRHQTWWRLIEPITDPVLASALVKGTAVKMNGDESVSNAGRVMRLAGSIAWGQKPGRVHEVTRIVRLKKPGLPEYPIEMLERFFPPAYDRISREPRTKNERGPDNGVVRASDSLGLPTGKVVDGIRHVRLRHAVS